MVQKLFHTSQRQSNYCLSGKFRIMKHPQQNTENYAFNLGKAPDLRCLQSSGTTTCTQCQNCKVREIVLETRQWFPRAGEKTKRRLVHGLIRRSYSQHLLKYIYGILKPLRGKDYGYSRSRPNPSLVGDRVDAGLDRALSSAETEVRMTGMYDWFRDAGYWGKVNILLAVLQMCDGQLLHSVGALTRTMLTAQERRFSTRSYDGDDYENESLADTVYSYNSNEHPENEWLRSAASQYSIPVNPFPEAEVEEEGEEDLDSSHITVEAASDEESDMETEDSSLDPRRCVTPVSRKALDGVMKYRDYIRDLPVHLSKYILSFMEYADLVNCLKVSRHWEAIAREVEEDMRLRQIMWEEVMLMQGSSAKGGNPVYADYIPVAVPQVVPASYEIFISEDEPAEVNFKSEINLESSYKGLITATVDMEARNVYCGAYNVMVLSDEDDFNRIVHYNHGELVAVGSFDRHVRFLDVNSGHETGPLITGHAGSIKSLYINEKDGFVLSGSFDTSIRCWSISTGKPIKIFNGHQSTVKCLDMFGDILVSGSKDNAVKVWNFTSGKCIRTFKHAKQINSVAIYMDTVVSGCEAGRVKVWSISKACLIKMLYKSPKQKNQYGISDPHTHAGPITCVKVDEYHIASGSRDGYALVWSAVGDVTKCINALRHPKEVLCLEMTYLRLVTGCEDGKLRIWNMLTGDCLRVMRGNSRSDPILTIHPCGDRLALNTVNNLLILNFEEIKWDYDQEEKIELLRYKNHFEEANLRHHNYAYVRANRSERAASANPKLVSHRTVSLANVSGKIHQGQFSHSGRSLSPKRMEHAEEIQKYVQQVKLTNSLKGSVYHNITDVRSKSTSDLNRPSTAGVRSVASRPGTGYSRHPSKSQSCCSLRPKSGTSSKYNQSLRIPSAKSYGGYSEGYHSQSEMQGDQSWEGNLQQTPSILTESGYLSSRPTTAKTAVSRKVKPSGLRMPLRGKSAPVSGRTVAVNPLTLSEARSLSNSRQRIEKNPIKRDKLLLSVGVLEASKQFYKPSVMNTGINTLTKNDIDTRVLPSHSAESETSSSEETEEEIIREKDFVMSETLIMPIETMSLDVKPHQSIHPKSVPSSIPRSNHNRPKTAQSRVTSRSQVKVQTTRRCKSSISSRMVQSGQSTTSSPVRKKKSHGWTTSCTEPVVHTPMLMHGKSRIEPNVVISVKGGTNHSDSKPKSTRVVTAEVKNPFHSHGEFQLRSRGQLEDYLNKVGGIQISYEMEKEKEVERVQKMVWKAKATGKTDQNLISSSRKIAPEIRE